MNNHNNLYLNIGSLLGSIATAVLWFVTNYYVMAILAFAGILVSITAGVMAIRAHYFTVREKKLNIQIMEDHVRKHKSGGHR